MSKLMAYFRLMRWHKPLPILLLLWPTYWGLWLAAKGFPGWHYFLVFTLGVLLMRAAGCVFNDIADRDFDKHVARTRMRPITSGMISVRQALILGFGLCLIAFALVLTLNRYAIYLSFAALGLALIYPLMKRITSMPQAALGLAFNFGLIMAYGALQNHIPSVAWLFYAAALCWTVAYDTWYALEDISDDIKIGVKSSARLFGKHAQALIALLQALSLILFALAGWMLECNGYYYCALLICIPLYAYQHHLARHKAYIPAFNHNHWVGLVIFIGILLQK